HRPGHAADGRTGGRRLVLARHARAGAQTHRECQHHCCRDHSCLHVVLLFSETRGRRREAPSGFQKNGRDGTPRQSDGAVNACPHSPTALCSSDLREGRVSETQAIVTFWGAVLGGVVLGLFAGWLRGMLWGVAVGCLVIGTGASTAAASLA